MTRWNWVLTTPMTALLKLGSSNLRPWSFCKGLSSSVTWTYFGRAASRSPLN
jgi:hypothetical protein